MQDWVSFSLAIYLICFYWGIVITDIMRVENPTENQSIPFDGSSNVFTPCQQQLFNFDGCDPVPRTCDNGPPHFGGSENSIKSNSFSLAIPQLTTEDSLLNPSQSSIDSAAVDILQLTTDSDAATRSESKSTIEHVTENYKTKIPEETSESQNSSILLSFMESNRSNLNSLEPPSKKAPRHRFKCVPIATTSKYSHSTRLFAFSKLRNKTIKPQFLGGMRYTKFRNNCSLYLYSDSSCDIFLFPYACRAFINLAELVRDRDEYQEEMDLLNFILDASATLHQSTWPLQYTMRYIRSFPSFSWIYNLNAMFLLSLVNYALSLKSPLELNHLTPVIQRSLNLTLNISLNRLNSNFLIQLLNGNFGFNLNSAVSNREKVSFPPDFSLINLIYYYKNIYTELNVQVFQLLWEEIVDNASSEKFTISLVYQFQFLELIESNLSLYDNTLESSIIAIHSYWQLFDDFSFASIEYCHYFLNMTSTQLYLKLCEQLKCMLNFIPTDGVLYEKFKFCVTSFKTILSSQFDLLGMNICRLICNDIEFGLELIGLNENIIESMSILTDLDNLLDESYLEFVNDKPTLEIDSQGITMTNSCSKKFNQMESLQHLLLLFLNPSVDFNFALYGLTEYFVKESVPAEPMYRNKFFIDDLKFTKFLNALYNFLISIDTVNDSLLEQFYLDNIEMFTEPYTMLYFKEHVFQLKFNEPLLQFKLYQKFFVLNMIEFSD